MRLTPRFLGWYHIAGAMAGAALTIWAVAHTSGRLTDILWSVAPPFALSFEAGRRLLRGGRGGRPLAYLVQALQIPIIILPIATWRFVAGVIASLTLTLDGLRLFGGFEATWYVGLGQIGNLPISLGLNVAPVVIIVCLRRMSMPAQVVAPQPGTAP